jgi:hypothetical protein
MKGEAVSAFRECGLHLAVRNAEPQVGESINSMERKPNTMKTYILRDLKAVEPQKPCPLMPSMPPFAGGQDEAGGKCACGSVNLTDPRLASRTIGLFLCSVVIPRRLHASQP